MEQQNTEFLMKGEAVLPLPFTASVFGEWLECKKNPAFITTIAELRTISLQVDNVIRNERQYLPNDIFFLPVSSIRVLGFRFIEPEALEAGVVSEKWEYHALVLTEGLEASVVLVLPERLENYNISFPLYF